RRRHGGTGYHDRKCRRSRHSCRSAGAGDHGHATAWTRPEAALNREKETVPIIETVEQLETIYGHPNEASTVKVADRVTPHYRVLIEKSPFVALATSGPEGLDCSPRG